MILDEIDGVGGSEGRNFIDTLLKMIKTQAKKPNKNTKESIGDDDDGSENEKEDKEKSSKTKSDNKRPRKNASGGKKKKKQAPIELDCPVICICNDLYAPFLRDLRLKAKVFNFDTPFANSRTKSQIFNGISQRLLEICRLEGISFEPAGNTQKIVNDLVNSHDGDIRLCLNTLQFCGKKQNKNELESSNSSSNNTSALLIAEKDTKTGYFKFLKQVFFDAKISSRNLPSKSKNSQNSQKNQENEKKIKRQEKNGLNDLNNDTEMSIDESVGACFENYSLIFSPDIYGNMANLKNVSKIFNRSSAKIMNLVSIFDKIHQDTKRFAYLITFYAILHHFFSKRTKDNQTTCKLIPSNTQSGLRVLKPFIIILSKNSCQVTVYLLLI